MLIWCSYPRNKCFCSRYNSSFGWIKHCISYNVHTDVVSGSKTPLGQVKNVCCFDLAHLACSFYVAPLVCMCADATFSVECLRSFRATATDYWHDQKEHWWVSILWFWHDPCNDKFAHCRRFSGKKVNYIWSKLALKCLPEEEGKPCTISWASEIWILHW